MNYSMPKYFQNMPQVGKALANIDEANENAVKEIDPKAFIIIMESNEVLGEGFKPH